MLPNISKLRLDNGGAARKPAPTDDNLVPLSVLDEPMTFKILKKWKDLTAQKAHDWFKAQSEDQRMCMYTTDSLAKGCDPADTETWNRLFWVATRPKITIPYAAQVSNNVPPEPDWAESSVALPIPEPWLRDGPEAIIQVTPSTAQGVPGVHFVHKATLLKMFAIQRQKYPDGVDGLSYPDAYKGPGYGKPDFFIPRPNGTNGRARIEMTAILDAFRDECDGYLTTVEFFLRNGTTLKAPVKLYEVGCDDRRTTFDFVDSQGESRQTNPFPTPWKYGTGTNILHYTNYTYNGVDTAERREDVPIFRFDVTEAPRAPSPPGDEDGGDPVVYGSGDEEEEEDRSSSSENSDTEMEDADYEPGPMALAIRDANRLDLASSRILSEPATLMPIVGLITWRLEDVDSDYFETLSDPDQAEPAFMRGLKRLWEGFHHLDLVDAIQVLALLDKAQEELGDLITFLIRQLVASDVPRLSWWLQANLRGVPEDDPRVIPAGGLLLLARGNDDLNKPKMDLQAFDDAVARMESLPRGSSEWSESYRNVTAAMRRIAHLAVTFDEYLQRVVTLSPPLAETVLRLVDNLLWDDLNDDWDTRHVRKYMQLPLIRFLDKMTELTEDMPRGFMNSLRNRKRRIVVSLQTFWQEYSTEEPELEESIQRVVERLEATPPPNPPSLASQRQPSAPAVQGAEALREIANSPSPERDEDEDEEVIAEGTVSPPARSLVRARSTSGGEATPGRRRQRRGTGPSRTGATLRRAGLLPRFF